MIIGLTGTLASGKDAVADYFKAKGFDYFSLSNEVREIAKEQRIEITRKNLQDLGNRQRREHGNGYLASRVAGKIYERQLENAVINGIRNPGEILVLRQSKPFFLIAVDAPREDRYQRLSARNRESDPKTWEKFLLVDDRDFGRGEKENGQAVGSCMKMANFKIYNHGTLEELEKKIEEVYGKIKQ